MAIVFESPLGQGLASAAQSIAQGIGQYQQNRAESARNKRRQTTLDNTLALLDPTGQSLNTQLTRQLGELPGRAPTGVPLADDLYNPRQNVEGAQGAGATGIPVAGAGPVNPRDPLQAVENAAEQGMQYGAGGQVGYNGPTAQQAYDTVLSQLLGSGDFSQQEAQVIANQAKNIAQSRQDEATSYGLRQYAAQQGINIPAGVNDPALLQKLIESEQKARRDDPFVKKLGTKAADYLGAVIDNSDSLAQSRATIDRIKEIIPQTKGLPGYWGTYTGLGERGALASELQALNISVMEPAIEILTGGRGIVTKEKMAQIIERVTIKKSDTASQAEGKIRAMESMIAQAEATEQVMAELADKYGGVSKIPVDEILKIQRVNTKAVEQISDAASPKDVGVSQKDAKTLGFDDLTGTSGDVIASQLGMAGIGGALLERTSENMQNLALNTLKASLGLSGKKEDPNPEFGLKDWIQAPFRKPALAVKNLGSGVAEIGDFLWDVVSWVGGYEQNAIQGLTGAVTGTPMTGREYWEAGMQLVTGDLTNEKTQADRIAGRALREGATFAVPIGEIKQIGDLGKIGKHAATGVIAGLAAQTAQEAGFDEATQLGALLLPVLYGPTKSGLMKAAAVAKDPKSLFNFSKNIGEPLNKKIADIHRRTMKIEPGQINEARAAAIKAGDETAQPLSSLFKNEKVLATEAKLAEGAGKQAYTDVIEAMGADNLRNYEAMLSDVSKLPPDEVWSNLINATDPQSLRSEFREALIKSREGAQSVANGAFERLRELRPPDARLTARETKNVIADIDKQMAELRKGGLAPKDKEPLQYLQDLKDDLLNPTASDAARIAELEAELQALGKKGLQGGTGREIRKELRALREPRAMIENVEAGYRKINQAINYDKALTVQGLRRINVQKALRRALESYGKKNPAWLKQFNAANKTYANLKETILSDLVWHAVEGKRPEALMGLLKIPEGVKTFDKIIGSDPQLLKLGRKLKGAVVNELLQSRFFDKGQFKGVGAARQLAETQRRQLSALAGKENLLRVERIMNDMNRVNDNLLKYANKSRTAANLGDSGRAAALYASAMYLAQGKPFKALGAAAVKFGPELQAKYFLDPEFQRALIEVVEAAKKPNNQRGFDFAVSKLGAFFDADLTRAIIDELEGPVQSPEAA